MTRFRCCSLLALLPLLAGCASLDLNLPDFGGELDQTARVGEIVCLWEHAEGVGLDGLPTRGFAGQILFFVKGQPEPVRINGDVRIYVFDDQGTEEEQSRPLHEFNFPADAWNTYLSRTNLGPAYQLFIPYTRKGGNYSNCSLRIRMSAEGRSPIYSKLASITLPGRKTAAANASTATTVAAPPSPAKGELQLLTEQAAIQRASAEYGVGQRTSQFNRLHEAAASAVQTADFSEVQSLTPETATSADYETEVPQSKRYKMSGVR